MAGRRVRRTHVIKCFHKNKMNSTEEKCTEIKLEELLKIH